MAFETAVKIARLLSPRREGHGGGGPRPGSTYEIGGDGFFFDEPVGLRLGGRGGRFRESRRGKTCVRRTARSVPSPAGRKQRGDAGHTVVPTIFLSLVTDLATARLTSFAAAPRRAVASQESETS
ncbi:hypothetical protein PUN28_003822 [Cardiocondyla obscurior]|uniref:Uncharacterized protein n=1 Tax=Cardiocondyla obscurior TaxID=286306 RepID=A0AAW2GNM6_9HYME